MALTPCSRCRKGNWLTVYENQCFIARNSTAEALLLGDSIVKGLNRYKGTWYKYFPNNFNFGISGVHAENILWRALQLPEMSYLKNVIILCGTNNICTDSPYDIAQCHMGSQFIKSYKMAASFKLDQADFLPLLTLSLSLFLMFPFLFHLQLHQGLFPINLGLFHLSLLLKLVIKLFLGPLGFSPETLLLRIYTILPNRSHLILLVTFQLNSNITLFVELSCRLNPLL